MTRVSYLSTELILKGHSESMAASAAGGSEGFGAGEEDGEEDGEHGEMRVEQLARGCKAKVVYLAILPAAGCCGCS